MKFTFLFLSIVCSQTLWSQSLSEYVDKAISNTDILTQNESHLKELSYQKDAAGLLENPSVGFEYGRVKNTGISGSLVGATVEQGIPLNGRLGLSEDKISEEMHKQKIVGNWQVDKLRAEVLENFLVLWLEREKISHAKHRIKDLKILRQYLSNRKFTSPQQKSDAYLIKKKVEEIEFQLHQNTYREKEVKRVLEGLTQEKIGYYEITLRSEDPLRKLFEEIIKESEVIQEYRKAVQKQSDLSLKQEERKWIPDMTLGYSYQKENVPGGNLSHAVGINFSIPIFNSGSVQANQVRAKMRVNKARWKREDLKRQAQARALRERFEYFLKLGGGSLYAKEVSHQKELKRIKDYFLKGLINAQTYLDAEEINHDLHYRQVNAKKEIVQVLIDTSLTFGKEIKISEVLK